MEWFSNSTKKNLRKTWYSKKEEDSLTFATCRMKERCGFESLSLTKDHSQTGRLSNIAPKYLPYYGKVWHVYSDIF